MDGEIIDKEVEPKKFNWWHLGIDVLIATLLGVLSTFGMVCMHIFYLGLTDGFNVAYFKPIIYGFPFKFFTDFGMDYDFIERFNWGSFLMNFLFYFSIIIFFLRYKNIKFIKRN